MIRGAAIALAAGTLLLLAGCGKDEEPVPERPSPTPEVSVTRARGSREVTDMIGRTVAIGDQVERVAALSPAAAEFAAALGLDVVGRTSDTPAAVAPGAAATGSTLSPDFNAVATLKPDLVLGDAAYHAGRTRDFDRFAFPVFVIKANSYLEVLATVTALGDAAGKTEEAEALRGSIQREADQAIAAAGARRAGSNPPRVLILTGGGRDVFAGGATSYLGDLVNMLGGVNVLGSTPEGGPIAGFGVVEVGQAAALNPDVVLILSSGQGGLKAQITSDAAWANTPAVRQGRVYELDTMLYLRSPGPRVGEALGGLAGLLWR